MPQEPASATSAADQAAAGGSVPWRSADAFERAEARGPQRTSGDGAWAAPTSGNARTRRAALRLLVAVVVDVAEMHRIGDPVGRRAEEDLAVLEQ